MPTPHISAQKGDFAKTVLMPGDPNRAKWIVENFLKDYKLVTSVRGILGYTGIAPNGKRISVMASGMGIPSIGIYSHELFNEYGVENIIRIGTCGSDLPDVSIGDVIIAMGASTDSNYAAQFGFHGTLSAIADYGLLEKTINIAKNQKIPFYVGNVFSSDIFYDDLDNYKKFSRLGICCVEMESYGLYVEAMKAKRKALTILTCSDNFNTNEHMNAEERSIGLSRMVKLALELAE